jgi:hypothetical protein
MQIEPGHPGQSAGAAKSAALVLKAVDSAAAGAQTAFSEAAYRLPTALFELSICM